MRILLIEDDEVLANVLLESLKSRHYVVDVATDGQLGWEYAQSANYDLLLMDVGLPKLDGIALCQQLRAGGCSTPILLMTAKDASADRIRGLDAGADDYLSKPLDVGELHARLRALLRRGEVIPTTVLEVGGLRLDPSRGQVTYHDRLLKLTPKEYMLLELLMRNPLRLPLVTSDSRLALSLPQLTQSEKVAWQPRETLESAQIWLKNHTPDLAILSVEKNEQWQPSLALISELAARTPPIPSLVLAATAQLAQRVAVARAGGQGILTQPVSAAQVWEVAAKLLQRRLEASVKVLAVDDDPTFLAALSALLEPWGIRVTGLDDPLNFWEVLAATAPDLLILDVEMPQLSGIDLCQAVRTAPQWQSLPILFLTARRERDTIQQVFAAGADDYVTKPVVGPELLTRITNRLERTRLLQTLSNREPLTGLLNQPQSQKRIEELLQQANREHSPLSLALVALADLDDINFQYGHGEGNRVLQHWGHLLRSRFWGGEVASYWGNGEFVIGLPGLSKTEADARLEDVLLLLRQQVFAALDGSRFQVNFRWGIAEYPHDGLTLQALYQAGRRSLSD